MRASRRRRATPALLAAQADCCPAAGTARAPPPPAVPVWRWQKKFENLMRNGLRMLMQCGRQQTELARHSPQQLLRKEHAGAVSELQMVQWRDWHEIAAQVLPTDQDPGKYAATSSSAMQSCPQQLEITDLCISSDVEAVCRGWVDSPGWSGRAALQKAARWARTAGTAAGLPLAPARRGWPRRGRRATADWRRCLLNYGSRGLWAG